MKLSRLKYLLIIFFFLSCNIFDSEANNMKKHSEESLINRIHSYEKNLSSLSSDTTDLEDESSEGSEKVNYFDGALIKHVRINTYGESGFSQITYYDMDRDSVIVVEKTYTYNQPIFMGDVEASDSTYIYFIMNTTSKTYSKAEKFHNKQKMKIFIPDSDIQNLFDLYSNLAIKR